MESSAQSQPDFTCKAPVAAVTLLPTHQQGVRVCSSLTSLKGG